MKKHTFVGTDEVFKVKATRKSLNPALDPREAPVGAYDPPLAAQHAPHTTAPFDTARGHGRRAAQHAQKPPHPVRRRPCTQAPGGRADSNWLHAHLRRQNSR